MPRMLIVADLEAIVLRAVAVGEIVDEAEIGEAGATHTSADRSGTIVGEGTAKLFEVAAAGVANGIDLVDVVDAVEFDAAIADVGNGQRRGLGDGLLDIQVIGDHVGSADVAIDG